MDADADTNPRPAKRQKILTPSLSSSSPTPRSNANSILALPKPENAMQPQHLLLGLPTLLAHPPAHKMHIRSLELSWFALKRCLSVTANEGRGLDAVTECRAWTELAEVGFRMGLRMGATVSKEEREGKEKGEGKEGTNIESEVQDALTKALLIAQKHPPLRHAIPRLTALSAHLAMRQGNARFAQNMLRRLVSSFLVGTDEARVVYSVWLGLVDGMRGGDSDEKDGYKGKGKANDKDAGNHLKVLSVIKDLAGVARRNAHACVGEGRREEKKGHESVVLLTQILELKELVSAGLWERLLDALVLSELALGLVFDDDPKVKGDDANKEKAKEPPRSGIETVLLVHVLIIGIIFHTHTGDAGSVQVRMKRLHEMLDGGALDLFGESGIVEIPFPPSPPLQIQVTHPRIIHTLAFLVSSVAKRDAVGRKPKRKLFASEGVGVVEREMRKEVQLPMWASIKDLDNYRTRMHKMKSDMMCEIVGVCITRSELDEADRTLASLIAHTRTHKLFSYYSARITLHHAHLAHARGHTERAVKCYRVAGWLSRRRAGGGGSKGGKPKDEPRRTGGEGDKEEGGDEGCEDPWVNLSARVGEVWLRLGVLMEEEEEAVLALSSSSSSSSSPLSSLPASLSSSPSPSSPSPAYSRTDHPRSRKEREKELETLRRVGTAIADECESMGGALHAVGAVLKACLAKEFLVAKSNLRLALSLTTSSGDNHLRALVLSFVAAQYMHTSVEHAEDMLKTAEVLVLGAGGKTKAASAGEKPGGKGNEGTGNLALRMWIGERVLELKKRVGDEEAVKRQVKINQRLGEGLAASRGNSERSDSGRGHPILRGGAGVGERTKVVLGKRKAVDRDLDGDGDVVMDD